jgi:hypothetical protein
MKVYDSNNTSCECENNTYHPNHHAVCLPAHFCPQAGNILFYFNSCSFNFLPNITLTLINIVF